MKENRRRAWAAVFLAGALAAAAPAWAEEAAPPTATASAVPASGPWTLSLGVEALGADGGGETLLPYGDKDSHLTFGGRFIGMSGLGLLDGQLRYGGGENFGLNADLHGTRGVVHLETWSVERNAERLSLPPSAAPAFTSDDQGPTGDPAVTSALSTVRAVVRPSTYPAHLSVAARRYVSKGERQQVFLDENCTTNCHLVSQGRRVDAVTDQLQLGVEGHAGLFDLSYRFGATRFRDEAPDTTFYFLDIPALRDSGNAAHNLAPDLALTEHALRVSTNVTGLVSAAAGLGVGERENRDADLKEAYRRVFGQVVYRPSRRLSLLLDSQQHAVQDEAPREGSPAEAARLADGLPLEYGSVENRHRAVLTYYEGSGFDLRGELVLREVLREDNRAWDLPDRSSGSSLKVTARMRTSSVLQVRAAVSAGQADDLPYATSPTQSSGLNLGARWNPSPTFSLTADLKALSDENGGSGWSNQRRLFNGGVTYVPSPPLSLSLFVMTFSDDVTTDLAFDGEGAAVVRDPDVPYCARGDRSLLQVTWDPSRRLRLTGDLSLLHAEGSYEASADPFADVEGFSRVDQTTSESALGFVYRLSEASDVAGRLTVMDFEDEADGDADESVTRVALSASRRW